MTVVEFVTAMAAALAVWSGGSALVCAWAAQHAARAAFPWRAGALGFIALAFAMIAIQQGRAVIAYETGAWNASNLVSWIAIGTRLGLAVSFHGLAYIVTRERCGARGVVALFALGLIAAGVTLAV